MSLKSKGVQIWARRLHIYISMALLFVVLFFAVTGITLNRPELFEASSPSIERVELSLPDDVFVLNEGRLVANEEKLLALLKGGAGISGIASGLDIYAEIDGRELVVAEASLDFKGPGYNAAVFIDVVEKFIEVEATDYGVIALLNDLHKGRNAGEVWKWFNDLTALLMIFFVLTGVCMLLPKKKTLYTSIKWTLFGSLLSFSVYLFAVP